jgi:AraC-like DNA-binding protein
MRSFSVKPEVRLTVMAACFGERPERAWLAELEAHDAGLSLTFVESRAALIKRARSLRPRIVLLPLRDARGVSSAPIIIRLREHAPNGRILLLIAPKSSHAGLAEAVRAGGEPLMLGGEEDLCSVLYRTGDLGLQSLREHDAIRSLLAVVRPVELREILHFCVMHAHRRLSACDVATDRRVSSRTLARRARAAGWPSLAELIDWGRLLRASLLQWRESSTLTALAHAAGFASMCALQGTAVQLLQRSAKCPSDLSPLLVSTRLHRRVKQMAGAETAFPCIR